MTPTPAWYDSPESEQMTVPTMKRGMTAFLITGYATLKIELPADWDALMAELGYRPLKDFYLKEGK